MSEFRELVFKTIRNSLLDSSEGCTVVVKIEEDVSENYFTIEGGDLVFKTTSASDAGKSNAALIGFLSRALKIPPSKIDIVYGVRGSVKRVLIRDVTCEDLAQKLQRVIRFA